MTEDEGIVYSPDQPANYANRCEITRRSTGEIRLTVNTHDARRFVERQAPEKQIVNQTEDGSVGADAESECYDSDGGETRRLHQHPKSKSDIGEHDQTS
jgi:hypothetical protein